MRSSHSAQHPHASYISPYPPAANPAYPAGHRSYRGDDSTVEATNTHYERPLATSRASLDSTNWNSQGNTQLTYIRDPSTLSPVPIPYGVPPVTSGPSINNRERTEVGQIKAPDTVDDCTSSSATEEASEERSELGYGVRLKLGGLELWLVQTFVFTTCKISESSTLLSGTRTKGSRAIRANEIPPKVNLVRGASDTTIRAATVLYETWVYLIQRGKLFVRYE